jgi:hypothetical protein
MTPVEHTKTVSSGQPSSFATAAVIALASAIPGSPVAALEFPELMMTARASVEGTRPFETMTGAPQTRFVVKTPAEAAGRSETNKARSGFPLALIPQVVPDAVKPTGRLG